VASCVAAVGRVDDRAVGEPEDVGQATVPFATRRLMSAIAPAFVDADAVAFEQVPGRKGALPVNAARADVNHDDDGPLKAPAKQEKGPRKAPQMIQRRSPLQSLAGFAGLIRTGAILAHRAHGQRLIRIEVQFEFGSLMSDGIRLGRRGVVGRVHGLFCRESSVCRLCQPAAFLAGSGLCEGPGDYGLRHTID
jgi:hypothetical protein